MKNQYRRYSDPKACNGKKIKGQNNLPKNQNSSKNSSKEFVKKFAKTFVKKSVKKIHKKKSKLVKIIRQKKLLKNLSKQGTSRTPKLQQVLRNL